jgi:hypothetical protein
MEATSTVVQPSKITRAIPQQQGGRDCAAKLQAFDKEEDSLMRFENQRVTV